MRVREIGDGVEECGFVFELKERVRMRVRVKERDFKRERESGERERVNER